MSQMPAQPTLEPLSLSGSLNPAGSGEAAHRTDSSLRGEMPWWGSLPLQLLLPALCLVPMLFYPLARDQGIFTYCGQVILDGGVPYRDVYEQKGPATHYTFALALLCGGSSVWAVRGMFYLVALCGSQLAAALGARWAGSAARIPCALCYALAMLQGDEGAPWQTGQVEDIIALLLMGSVVLIGRADLTEKAGRVFLAGLLLGLACTYKPTALLPALAVAGVVFYQWRKRLVSWKRIGQLFGFATVGFLLPAASFAGWLAYCGALDDFWMFVVDHNLNVYNSGEYRPRMIAAFWLVDAKWGRLVLLALMGLALVRTRSRLLSWMLAAVLLSSWGAVIWQGKFWQYHWTPAIAALAVFAGVGLAWLINALLNFIHWNRASWLGAVLAAVVLANISAPNDSARLLDQWVALGHVARGNLTLEDFQGRFLCGNVEADDHAQVAQWIRERTSPEDTVLVWGHEAVLHVLADRRAPSRFVLNRTLCHPDSRHMQAWRAEYMQDVEENQPELIVVAQRDATRLFPRGSVGALHDFPELSHLLEEKYVRAARVSNFQIYRRSQPTYTAETHDYRSANRLGN